MSDVERRTGGEVLERTRHETKKPELFKVLLINDDYTTMEFVVDVLESIFHKQPAEAYRIMMMVHTQGKGLCGVYPHEVAASRCWRRWNQNSGGWVLLMGHGQWAMGHGLIGNRKSEIDNSNLQFAIENRQCLVLR